MRYALALGLALVACAVATSGAWAGAPQRSHGYRFITDTLGGNGHTAPAQGAGYRFITDTLAGGGGTTQTTVVRESGFSWTDAGIGAGGVAGVLLVIAGAAGLVRRGMPLHA